MKRLLLAGAALIATPSLAQEAQDPHAGHDMSQMQGMDHSGHDMNAMNDQSADGAAMQGMDHSMHQQTAPDAPQAGTPMDHSAHMGHTMPTVSDSEVGNAPPPPVPTDHPADAFWDKQRMAQARADLSKEGRFFGNALILDRFEYRPRNGTDGYAWQAMGWIGGDIDRLAVETEGEGGSANPSRPAKSAPPGAAPSIRGGTSNSACGRISVPDRTGLTAWSASKALPPTGSRSAPTPSSRTRATCISGLKRNTTCA